MHEKDEELNRKDAVIKNLTQKQIELSEELQKYRNYIDGYNDLKNQVNEL